MKRTSPSIALVIGLIGLIGLTETLSTIQLSEGSQQRSSRISAEQSSVRIRARDSRLGRGVAANLKLYRSQEPIEPGSSVRPDLELSLRTRGRTLRLPTGDYQFELESSGYETMRSRFTVDAVAPVDFTVWLDPLPTAIEGGARETKSMANLAASGLASIAGYVIDAQRGTPVVGATVRLLTAGASGSTDAEGHFSLSVSSGGAEASQTDTLEIRAQGFRNYVGRNLTLASGELTLIVDLERGRGETEKDLGHRNLVPEGEEGSVTRQARPPLEAAALSALGSVGADLATAAPGPGLTHIDPPNTIRVGYTSGGNICCNGSCSTTQVLSLETYVRRGLGDEWISSWDQDSLRAGAIAYRSYGAWHALNPRPGRNYDICSSACCQVNTSNTLTSTDLAVAATSGLMAERNGSVFFAEYSGENNSVDFPSDGRHCSNIDLSCGDGFAGSPNAKWPCLFDEVGAGKGCSGHGRGMSQWGSSRWANRGRSWSWILNHYYNDSGNGDPASLRSAYASSPIRIDGASMSGGIAKAGNQIQLAVSATNTAEGAHSRILLGASLASPSGQRLLDAKNDVQVSLPRFASTRTRAFDLPLGIESGAYDLTAELWLDVDEDSRIGDADVLLSSRTFPDAVGVNGGIARTVAIAMSPGGGHWAVTATGKVTTFGAQDFGSIPEGTPLVRPIVGMAAHPSGNGYWLVAADGGIFAFGAPFHGSRGGQPLDKPIVGMAAHPSGNGYWLVASDGGIFAYGAIPFHGSRGGQPLDKPIVGMGVHPSGNGYWLLAADGGIFAYGAIPFHGSRGGQPLSRPIVGMGVHPSGDGYWLVAGDGGIFTYGAIPFHGSGAGQFTRSVVGMSATPDGNGYRMIDERGRFLSFGSAVP